MLDTGSRSVPRTRRGRRRVGSSRTRTISRTRREESRNHYDKYAGDRRQKPVHGISPQKKDRCSHTSVTLTGDFLRSAKLRRRPAHSLNHSLSWLMGLIIKLASIFYDKAGIQFFDGPRRREAALGQAVMTLRTIAKIKNITSTLRNSGRSDWRSTHSCKSHFRPRQPGSNCYRNAGGSDFSYLRHARAGSTAER